MNIGYWVAAFLLGAAALLVLTKVATTFVLLKDRHWGLAFVAGFLAVSDALFTAFFGMGAAAVTSPLLGGMVAGVAGLGSHFILGTFLPDEIRQSIHAARPIWPVRIAF